MNSSGQSREADAELATARKVILALALDEAVPHLPDGPVYLHALTVLAGTTEPVSARDLCSPLDTGCEPTQIVGVCGKHAPQSHPVGPVQAVEHTNAYVSLHQVCAGAYALRPTCQVYQGTKISLLILYS
ncbi:hypothetical protein KGQ19_11175 [Catenulispora sp. NL8]|uniref:Uncharacterized protein n=1 Tax=Catenulispora pinistramenti TaxID=2705254 RepID=A0ABS5KN16_9ACTN|nr:hypothetical protein [Catenulispora pinistramenti]MBS2547433.1 hypothetical protein [Catenulispora pinistramenti]